MKKYEIDCTNGHRRLTVEQEYTFFEWVALEWEWDYHCTEWKETGKRWDFETLQAAKFFIQKELF